MWWNYMWGVNNVIHCVADTELMEMKVTISSEGYDYLAVDREWES